MENGSKFVRPVILIEGGNYLMVEPENNGSERVYRPVTLAAYDACPAFVIVRNEFGDKQRCPRESLFINNHLTFQTQ